MYIHCTLLPYIKAAGEMKTKPTQHSVKELRGLGIQPDIIVVRTEYEMTQDRVIKSLYSVISIKIQSLSAATRTHFIRFHWR